jgi:serine O-acetyltransferase
VRNPSFLTSSWLTNLIKRQIDALFILEFDECERLEMHVQAALSKSVECFRQINNKYFVEDDEVRFSPYHTGQHTIFLYFLSRQISGENKTLADKVYYLNKALNGVDLFHEVELPAVFFTDHPTGSVIGRGKFGDRFMFSQNCTVGNNRGNYPVIGRNVFMLVGSKIIGKCNIGDNVILGANACVIDEAVPHNSLVFGQSPHLVVKPAKLRHFEDLNFFTPLE